MPKITKKKAHEIGLPNVTVQTILFDKQFFTLAHAKVWLRKHKYPNFQDYRETTNNWHFWQTPDVRGAIFWSRPADSDGIMFTYQKIN